MLSNRLIRINGLICLFEPDRHANAFVHAAKPSPLLRVSRLSGGDCALACRGATGLSRSGLVDPWKPKQDPGAGMGVIALDGRLEF